VAPGPAFVHERKKKRRKARSPGTVCWDGKLRHIRRTEDEVLREGDDDGGEDLGPQAPRRPRRVIHRQDTPERMSSVSAVEPTVLPELSESPPGSAQRSDVDSILAKHHARKMQVREERRQTKQFEGNQSAYSAAQQYRAAIRIQARLRGWLSRTREQRRVVTPFHFMIPGGHIYHHRGRRKPTPEVLQPVPQGRPVQQLKLDAKAVLFESYQQVGTRSRAPKREHWAARKVAAEAQMSVHAPRQQATIARDSAVDVARRRQYLQDSEDEEVDLHLLEMFRVIDHDGDSLISPWDLLDHLAASGLIADSKEMRRAVKIADVDGDGRLNLVEFCACIESIKEMMKEVTSSSPSPRRTSTADKRRQDLVAALRKTDKPH